MFQAQVQLGIWIPLIGTFFGAACVFFVRRFNIKVKKVLSGFAAGVMVAASIFSLIVPSVDLAKETGQLSFLPATIGFLIGIGFLLLIDHLVPHQHVNEDQPEGIRSALSKNSKMLLAVGIHNIPEGMAVGVVLAGYISGTSSITIMGALALAIGIAIQNIPEGAIISMPLAEDGMKKGHAFLFASLTGIVEPIGTILMILFASFLTPALPYFLSFAAGAMMYVVIEELVPEMTDGGHSHYGVIAFAIGFVLMMILDITLG